jgi:Lrp/AsnC family leucine-responsive transcriptional regulator
MVDELDLKILQIVQEDNRVPAEIIAQDVGLSASAVHRRLKRLRKDGIIRADVSVISPDVFGNLITAIIQVSLEKENKLTVNEFKHRMARASEVSQAYFVTGEADFILVANFKDMEAYERFTQRHFTDNQNISRYHTSIVINQIKTGFRIPST